MNRGLYVQRCKVGHVLREKTMSSGPEVHLGFSVVSEIKRAGAVVLQKLPILQPPPSIVRETPARHCSDRHWELGVHKREVGEIGLFKEEKSLSKFTIHIN